jgi:ABC-type Fe3+-hydroxamate transport system substrate-binding protein
MTRTLLALSAFALLGLTACEDEASPAHSPQITRGDVLCRSLDADNFTLDRVDVTVIDLDGFAEVPDHATYAVVEATSIELEAIPQDWDAADGKCSKGNCKMLYRWERSPRSEQFFCGADGKLLEVDFEVVDPDGLSHRAYIASRPR